jgi:NADH-quinone oxidoreductase subunit M
MLELHTLLTMLAVLVPAAASAIARKQEWARATSAAASAISFLFVAAAVWGTPHAPGVLSVDNLAAAPALAVTALIFGVLLSAPRRDVSGVDCAGVLLILSGTLTVYFARDLLIIFAGFVISALPFLKRRPAPVENVARFHAQPRALLVLAVFLFGASIVLKELFPHDASVATMAFGLLSIAALIRNGIFPFHSWLVTACEETNPMLFSALISGQTGAFLLIRIALPLFPDAAAQLTLPIVSSLALIGTLFTAFLALGEKIPRRILALLAASQSGFLFSGLESRNVEGITGALVYWIVISLATPGALMVLRCTEARYGDLVHQRFAGLGARAPRLAVCFLIFAMALVGLPGTLGFCAEDLLFHGALEAHGLLGAALPLATALSAIQLLRLYSWVFRGRNAAQIPVVADALPRERVAFTAIILFLVMSGLLPHAFVASREIAAEHAVSVLTAGTNNADAPIRPPHR